MNLAVARMRWRSLVVVLVVSLLGLAIAAVALATVGSLDAGFGRGGKVLTGFMPLSNDEANAVVVQPNGGIVVAGSSSYGGEHVALARYSASGQLDLRFGRGGKTLSKLAIKLVNVDAMAVQPNGKIVVAGTALSSRRGDFFVARYSANGSLDRGFGSNGVTLTDFGSNGHTTAEIVRALALQPDGKIVVAGTTGIGRAANIALARYTATGRLDTGFGQQGTVARDFGTSSEDSGWAVGLQSDGKIVVAGASKGARDYDFAVARYDGDGSPDAGFGQGGLAVADFSSSSADLGFALALQRDGKIVVAGVANLGNFGDFAVARFKTDGALDTEFTIGPNLATGESLVGMVRTKLGDLTHNFFTAVAIQSDGKIVAVGESDVVYNRTRSRNFVVFRFTTNGAPDAGFGSGGVVLTDFGINTAIASDDHAHAAAIQSDGKILVVGSSAPGTLHSRFRFALTRYLAR